MSTLFSFVQPRLSSHLNHQSGSTRQNDQQRHIKQCLATDLLNGPMEHFESDDSNQIFHDSAGSMLHASNMVKPTVKSPSRPVMLSSKSSLSDRPASSSSSPETDMEPHYEPYRTTAQGFPVNNKLRKGKYATGIDDRGYLSGMTTIVYEISKLIAAVYEFQLNDQTIMWDYCTGLVHLTGIWKALGNSKADIVRLVDSHPELEGVIRRIRGGFLKIQGTWVPYELCKKLALRTCYTIRHALISLFGPSFPEECLKPDVRGYGTLTLDDSGIDSKKRKKRKLEAAKKQELLRSSQRAPSEREGKSRPQRHKSRRLSVVSSDVASTTTTTTKSDFVSPPPIPRIVDVSPSSGGFYPSKTELLDLLRASRCLQMMSAGTKGQDWEAEGFEPLGGRFDLSGTGTTFHWDGKMSGTQGLDIVGDQNHRQDLISFVPPLQDCSSSMTDSAPMLRKSSSMTSESSEYGAMTPPHTYAHVNVGMRQVPASPISLGHWSEVQILDHKAGDVVANKARIRTSGIDILSSW